MNDTGVTLLYVALGIIVVYILCLTPAIMKSDKSIQEAEELVLDDEWTTYINGNVVDGKGVTVANYYVELDYENKIVKLTTKQTRTTFIPTFIPMPIK